ncbi:hypothetical protein GGQ68_002523 [Sagittula marina]|uniref:Uncharacterized protein n=1 Tax=Sagittula marina TaxID=943940 RepID=A0A7W6DN58_9RHOB|nr:hypothetical protein [Sagittula marina]MBB3986185.1 hypothetical protein [Sagittula marina]
MCFIDWFLPKKTAARIEALEAQRQKNDELHRAVLRELSRHFEERDDRD